MPRLEQLRALETTGTLSIWRVSYHLRADDRSMVLCLVPVVLSLFVSNDLDIGFSWAGGVLYGGVYGRANPLTPGTILSRIGIWSFDLCQLKLLQMSLDDHPYRNRITALQLALQHSFNLLKFTLTMIASRSQNFKWTGLVSLVAVTTGAVCYGVYLLTVQVHR